MKKLFLIPISMLLAYSCSNTSNAPASGDNTASTAGNTRTEFQNDMESALAGIPSWSNEKTIIKAPDDVKAHSGVFVSKVDDVDRYSYAFKENFENINQKLPVKVNVSGWFYSKVNNPKLGWMMDINENNQTKIWKAYDLMQDSTPLNTWNEFKASFTIDQPIKPNYQIKLFGFGDGKEAFFDDITVTFEY